MSTRASLILLFAALGCSSSNSSDPPSTTVPDAGPEDGASPSDTGTTTTPTDGGNEDGGVVDYPSEPPKVCDTTILAGPATAPAGAVVVKVGTDLSTLVDDKPAGTTFYLEAGVHKLAKGEFEQVIPKDGDTFIGAPGAILDGQHSNLYAFTQHAKNVTLRYFTIQNFGTPGSTNNEGTVNHDAGEGWVIEYMTIQKNSGAGVFIGSGNKVRYNCLRDNGQYGFSSYSEDGIKDILLDHNEISGNNTDDWEKRIDGCGCTGGGKFWDVHGAVVTNNYVHDNKSVGLWADTNNVGFDFSGNWISGNDGPGIFYEISYNARIAHNRFVRNAIVDGPTNPGFPTGAIYLSESGGDTRAGSMYSTLEIANNLFEDNWSGVVLWENADRFCNSPANTSSDYCTIVGSASLANCVSGKIAGAPYYSDCRWKTQNVAVHDNTFKLNPTAVGTACKASNGCGFQGLFSNFGTFPAWSPYKGDVVEKAITFDQKNVFSKNTYVGPWKFMAKDQDTELTPAQWQAAPYNQDVGSEFK